jgi:hypothetical protein
MRDAEQPDLEREVAGEYNTFRVYVLLLKVRKASTRQVQRALRFSSPHLASHHLEKLRRVGLVEKDEYGEFHVIPKTFGILRLFVVLRRWIVPRSVFTVVIFSTMIIGFLMNITQHKYFIVALVVSLIGLIASVYDTVRFYRILPETK